MSHMRKRFPECHYRLADILIEARRRARISQAELAWRLKVSQTLIARIESKTRQVNFCEVILISQALGVDPRRIIRQALRGVS